MPIVINAAAEVRLQSCEGFIFLTRCQSVHVEVGTTVDGPSVRRGNTAPTSDVQRTPIRNHKAVKVLGEDGISVGFADRADECELDGKAAQFVSSPFTVSQPDR